MSKHTKCVVYGAMLAATAFVLTLVTRLQIFPSASFLEYEAGDVPLFLSAVILGPWTGLLITAVACVLQGITISASSGIIGIIMHFLSTGSFVLVAGLIAKRRTALRVIPAYLCGASTMVLIMIPLNLILTPVFMIKGNVFSAAAQNAVAVAKATFTLPDGIMKFVSIGVCAAAFVLCFMLVQCFMRKKDENGKTTHTALNIVVGIVAGLVYALLALLLMNLIFSDIAFEPGVGMVYGLMFTTLIPFNVIKAFANAFIAGILYALLAKHIKLDVTKSTIKD